MQFLQITKNTTLTSLKEQVGSRNVDSILSLNSVARTPNIGKALDSMYESVKSASADITYQRKKSILNTLTSDSDVFETAALLSEDGWKFLSALNTFPQMLRIPEVITLPDATNILGGGSKPVSETIYSKAMAYLDRSTNVDPIIFNEYSSRKSSQIVDTTGGREGLSWFNIPWGMVTLHSNMDNTSIDFPVYPEEYDDSYVANYDTMPDMIYQYEPWYIYKGSGPRTVPLTFKMHRDMWTGDHRDGKCNDLLRFCEANCYARYSGASVITPIVTFYIKGRAYISGIMTEAKPHFYGPIGLDNFPLAVDLSISITEVSKTPLSFDAIRKKGLIE